MRKSGRAIKGGRRVEFVRSAEHPKVEDQLYQEYISMRKKGLKVRNSYIINQGQC